MTIRENSFPIDEVVENMKLKKNVILVASLMSTLVLTGCASNDELVNQQKQYEEQIGSLEAMVGALELRVTELENEQQAQKEIDTEILQRLNQFDADQAQFKVQMEQAAEQAKQYAEQQKIEQAKQEEAKKQPVAQGTKRYTVQKGDTLYSLSVEFNSTVDGLLQLNPHVKSPRHLAVGQVINIK